MDVSPAGIDNINEVALACQTLLSLAKDKQQAILAGDTHRLQAIVADEEAVLAQLDRIKVEQLFPQRRDQIAQWEEILGDTFIQLRAISEENMMLLRQSLRYVQWMQRLIASEDAPPTYGSDGAAQTGVSGRRVVDQKA